MRSRPTPRELGLRVGDFPAGSWNAITDVAGVRVGQVTLIRGDGPLVVGQGPVRTGVTAILPHGGDLFRQRPAAGVFVLNGFGKSVGLPQVEELGFLEGPILLCGTQNVWRVADAAADWMLQRNPEHGIGDPNPNPVVGECNDGHLNDMQGRHVGRAEVFAALDGAAPGPVAQGCAGAGTGTRCYGYKGGIGTASRRLPDGYTLGCLLQSNFGSRHRLQVLGVPVGQGLSGEEKGSVMVILATDAPLDQRQLTRLCRRAALGLARTGSYAGNTSGDFILAFSTTNALTYPASGREHTLRLLHDFHPAMNDLFAAAVEATEEAVYASLFCATDMTGRDGHFVPALPVDQVLALLRQAGRL